MMEQIYISKKNGIGIEYTGGLNFADGKRNCPKCNFLMERKPIGEPFIKVPFGKILVNIDSNNGHLKINNCEPDYIWTCKNELCNMAISTTNNNIFNMLE
jgi:hypothetical protein